MRKQLNSTIVIFSGTQSWGKVCEMVLYFCCKPRSFALLSSSLLLEIWGKSIS